jgi:hypothetical protein
MHNEVHEPFCIRRVVCLRPRAQHRVTDLNMGTDVPLDLAAVGLEIKLPALRAVVYAPSGKA